MRIDLAENGRIFRYWPILAAAALLATFGVELARRGIDLTDEGMYLATSMRYALGDTPFRDEIMNAARPFDILVSSIFWMWPEATLLDMRLIGVILHVTASVSFAIVMSRWAPTAVVALAMGVGFVFANPYNLLTPSYYTLPSDFLALTMAALILARRATQLPNRWGLSIIAALCFDVAAFSYLPLFALLAVPAVDWLLLRRRSPIQAQASLIMLLTSSFLMLCAVVVVGRMGLFPEWWEGIVMTVLTQGEATGGLLARPWALISEAVHFVPFSLIILMAGMLLLGRVGSRQWLRILTFLVLVIPVLAYALTGSRGDRWFFQFVFVLTLSTICWDVLRSRIQGNFDPEWNIDRNTCLAWGMAGAILLGLTSTGGIRNSMLAIGPLAMVALIGLYRTYRKLAVSTEVAISSTAISSSFVLAIPILLLARGMLYSYDNVYRDAQPGQLTQYFSHKKLSGIRSSPKKVQALERVLSYLEGKVQKGDYFLAYNYIPILYFLTDTRPALRVAWARDDWSIALRRQLVEDMVAAGRLPEYVVRAVGWPEQKWNIGMPYLDSSPLNQYVMSHYVFERQYYPFEIWRRGSGVPYQTIDKWPLVFSYSLGDRGSPSGDVATGFSSILAPLDLLGLRGNFLFSLSKENGTPHLRLQSGEPRGAEKLVLKLGLGQGRNGFGIAGLAGKEVVFSVSAKVSEPESANASVFIQDKDLAWKVNSVSISSSEWQRYVVSYRVGTDDSNLMLGIEWLPLGSGQTVDVREIEIRLVPDSGDDMKKAGI